MAKHPSGANFSHFEVASPKTSVEILEMLLALTQFHKWLDSQPPDAWNQTINESFQWLLEKATDSVDKPGDRILQEIRDLLHIFKKDKIPMISLEEELRWAIRIVEKEKEDANNT